MIIEVVKDMRYFFLVILTTTAAFGDSFLKLSLIADYTTPADAAGSNAAAASLRRLL